MERGLLFCSYRVRIRPVRRGLWPRVSSLLLAAFLIGAFAPTVGFADEMDEQAQRQLELARSDLEAGNPERALSAAQSALRLDPRLYEAMVLKALAYEALGDVDRAKALLTAYLEFTAGIEPSPEALEALDRMTTKKERREAEKAERKQAKDEKKRRKSEAKEEKKADKARAKEEKKADKARAKEEKKADKAAEKDAKKDARARAKAEKSRERARKKAAEAQKKADEAQKKADEAQKKAEESETNEAEVE